MSKNLTNYDHLAGQIHRELPAGPRVIVIGSASFWHPDSEALCEEMGRLLVTIPHLSLVTGGVGGVGATVGKSFYRHGKPHSKPVVPVFHVLPEGELAPNYGQTFFAGQDMFERREVLARLGPLFLAIEGGPGTAHEARVAVDHGATIVPVGRSGGVAAQFFEGIPCPPWAAEQAWAEMGRDCTEVRKVANAVHELIGAAISEICWS